MSHILIADSGQWLGAPTAVIPADGPTYGPNSYPVKSIQTYLTRAGIPTPVDGIYGSTTTANVKTFQTRYGLLADGAVGSVTWSKMLSLKRRQKIAGQHPGVSSFPNGTADVGCVTIPYNYSPDAHHDVRRNSAPPRVMAGAFL